MRVKRYMQNEFLKMINRPKVSTLRSVAKKIKSLFKFGSKKDDESVRKF
jgi:hypothetical protein